MNNKKNKGGRNPKLDPATNRYSVNFSSEEDVRFLRMFDRSGMTSKSAFIKARIFGEPFHVVTFDKSQYEYYAKLSDFHTQFRMVGNRSAIGRFACKELQPDIEGTEEPIFRAQNRSIGVQVGEIHDAVGADYV